MPNHAVRATGEAMPAETALRDLSKLLKAGDVQGALSMLSSLPQVHDEHPWEKARRLSKELSEVMAECDDGTCFAHVMPAGRPMSRGFGAFPMGVNEEYSVDKVNRLGWELAQALNSYADGKMHAQIFPSEKYGFAINFVVTELQDRRKFRQDNDLYKMTDEERVHWHIREALNAMRDVREGSSFDVSIAQDFSSAVITMEHLDPAEEAAKRRRIERALLAPASGAKDGTDTLAIDNSEGDSACSLGELLNRHASTLVSYDAAWNRVSEIQDSAAMEASPIVRVQVGRRLKGRDDNGAEVWDPIYAYSAEQVTKRVESHMEAQLSIFPGDRNSQTREKIKSGYRERMRQYLNQLDALRAECERIEIECGYTHALQEARANSDELKEIERLIIDFVPKTLGEASLKARWIAQAYDAQSGYIGDDENNLKFAIDAIGRAV